MKEFVIQKDLNNNLPDLLPLNIEDFLNRLYNDCKTFLSTKRENEVIVYNLNLNSSSIITKVKPTKLWDDLIRVEVKTKLSYITKNQLLLNDSLKMNGESSLIYEETLKNEEKNENLEKALKNLEELIKSAY